MENSRHIQNLIETCLSIHHGRKNVERSLSDNKNVLTKEGTSLSEETLIGLPRCKQHSRNAGGAYQALVSRKIISKVKNNYLNHTIPNMQKKEEEESQKKQSKQAQEDQYRKQKELEEKVSKHHEKEKELLYEEKKVNEEMAIAWSMITEGNKRLATAGGKKDMNEIATANDLIDSAKKRFDSIQKSITSVQERHVNLLGKRKKYEEFNKEMKKSVNNANISNLY